MSLIGPWRCDTLPTMEDEHGNVVGVLVSQLDQSGQNVLLWNAEDDSKSIERIALGQKLRMMVPMLNDSVRNELYNNAITSAIADFINKHNRAPIVLDIGAGTGFLSLLCARAGAKKVYACEMISSLAKYTRETVKENNYSDIITVINKLSSDLSYEEDIPADLKFDIIVTETLDSNLLDEGIVDSVDHALKHFGHADTVVIPEKATVWIQILDCTSSFSHAYKNRILVNKNGSVDIDGCLCRKAIDQANYSLVNTHVGKSTTLKELGAPIALCSINFTKPTFLSERILDTKFSVSESGTAKFVVLYWDLYLYTSKRCDEEPSAKKGKCNFKMLSTNYLIPENDERWQDHWFPVLIPIHTSPRVISGNHLSMQFLQTRNSIKLLCCGELEESNVDGVALYPLKHMNVSARNLKMYRSLLSESILNDGAPLEIWDLSDGSLLALIAASLALPHKRVYSVQDETTRAAWCDSSSTTNLLITESFVSSKNPVLLMTDFFYDKLQSDPIMACLYFLYQVHHIRQSSQQVTCFPKTSRLMSCIIDSRSLSRCMKPPHSILGLEHNSIAGLWDTFDSMHSISLWNYTHEIISEHHCVAEIDYESGAIKLSENLEFDIQSANLDTLLFVVYASSDVHGSEIFNWDSVQMVHFLDLSLSNSTSRTGFGNPSVRFNIVDVVHEERIRLRVHCELK